MTKDFALYKRLLGYAWPYWPAAAVSVLALVISAALEPVLPALMRPLIDQSLIAKDAASLWQVPLLIVVTFLVKGLADYVGNVASQTLAQKTMADLRQVLFGHQLQLPLSVHQAEPGGRMLSRITYDINLVGEAVSTAWLTLIKDTLVLIGLLGFLFYTAWQLTLLILIMAPVLALVIRATNHRLRRSSSLVQSWVGRLTGLIEEALLGLKDIKIFGAQDKQATDFAALNQSLRREQMRAIRVQALNVPLVQVLAACSVALVIYVASRLNEQDLMTPGEFVAFITAMSMVFEPVRRLTNVNAVLQRGLAAAESVFALLDTPAETSSMPTATAARQASDRVRGEIHFEQVGYRYQVPSTESDSQPDSQPELPAPEQSWAVRGFDLSVRAGEVVALVGPSGSGKSTLLYLLCGFDRPEQGRIQIDGQDIADWPVDRLRRQIAWVSQRVMLFDQTIEDNIRMGQPQASAEQVEQAARAAHAWDFISQLPLGLATPLGSLGDRLSGGQRQRIAMARAFLKDAPILLLDEATSALDRESEQAVLQGLADLMKGRTVLLISHAPERLIHVDRTVVLG